MNETQNERESVKVDLLC